MRLYLSGPMRKRKFYNFGAFDLAAIKLKDAGYEVINPADIDRANSFDPFDIQEPDKHDWSKVPEGFNFKKCRARDIKAIEDCDGIYLLDGWEDSVGAHAEKYYAEWAGKAVHYQSVYINNEQDMTAQERKERPVYSGVLKYFPNAIMAVANCSWVGNEQHNPGTELHWDREKSGDELDALSRHLIQAGTMDNDGIRHSAKIAWRALANLEKEIENEQAV